MDKKDLTTTGPQPAHPLHGIKRHGASITVIILLGWLAHLGWSVQQILPVLILLVPAAEVRTAGQA